MGQEQSQEQDWSLGNMMQHVPSTQDIIDYADPRYYEDRTVGSIKCQDDINFKVREKAQNYTAGASASIRAISEYGSQSQVFGELTLGDQESPMSDEEEEEEEEQEQEEIKNIEEVKKFGQEDMKIRKEDMHQNMKIDIKNIDVDFVPQIRNQGSIINIGNQNSLLDKWLKKQAKVDQKSWLVLVGMKSLNESQLLSAKSSVIRMDQKQIKQEEKQLQQQRSHQEMSRQLREKLNNIDTQKFDKLRSFDVQIEEESYQSKRDQNPFSPQTGTEDDDLLLFEPAKDDVHQYQNSVNYKNNQADIDQDHEQEFFELNGKEISDISLIEVHDSLEAPNQSKHEKESEHKNLDKAKQKFNEITAAKKDTELFHKNELGDSIIPDTKNHISMHIFPSANLSHQGVTKEFLSSPPHPKAESKVIVLQSEKKEKITDEIYGSGELSTCDANSITTNQTAYKDEIKLKDNQSNNFNTSFSPTQSKGQSKNTQSESSNSKMNFDMIM